MGSSATLEEVRAAAKEAQIDDFIMSLPDGYDTKVGSFGSRFSGGEKQRIAIARAILKNAPILILDEATSASDLENQMEIDKAIQNLCKGKTVIVVRYLFCLFVRILLRCIKITFQMNTSTSEAGGCHYAGIALCSSRTRATRNTVYQLRKDCYLPPVNGLFDGILSCSPISSSFSWFLTYSAIRLSFFPTVSTYGQYILGKPANGMSNRAIYQPATP